MDKYFWHCRCIWVSITFC